MERGSRVFAEFGEDIYMIEVGGCDAGEIDASVCDREKGIGYDLDKFFDFCNTDSSEDSQ